MSIVLHHSPVATPSFSTADPATSSTVSFAAPTPSSLDPAPASVASAMWHALAKVGVKLGDRDDLSPGSSYDMRLHIYGLADGYEINEEIGTELTVGHDSIRSRSATPDADAVVAWILNHLNHQTRDAILRDLPGAFETNGNVVPESPKEIVDATAAMFKRLRAKVQQPVRGSVSIGEVVRL